MTITLSMPEITELHPRILVIGVGGAGGNAVNNMIKANLEGVDFVVANTDAQALAMSSAKRRIQLGIEVTRGLGAGSRPEVGQAAAEETIDQIHQELNGAHMAFITAGLGGGTGTGAAPVIAKAAREMGILTVGVVTKPFQFEGTQRARIADAGLAELQHYVDTLIVIPNQNLFRIANEKTTFADAFAMADNVLHSGVRGITDLMVMPGLINLDFADVKTVIDEMGKAMMGTGEAEGEKRALEAAEAAISNPLLDDVSLKGAKGVLINITGGDDLTLFEVDEATNRIRAEVDADANIIIGSTFDNNLNGAMRVSVFASGIGEEAGEEGASPGICEVGLTPDIRTIRRTEVPEANAPTGTPEVPAAARVRRAEVDRTIAAFGRAPAAVGGQAVTGDEIAAEPCTEPEPEPEPVEPATASDLTPEPMVAAKRRSPIVVKHRDAPFIAPEPVEATAPETPARAPDPFAEAAMTNGPKSTAPARRGRGPSLFERMTGKAPAAKADKKKKPVQPVEDVERAPALGGLEPEDRIYRRPEPEDQLEIPAFLRRQAN